MRSMVEGLFQSGRSARRHHDDLLCRERGYFRLECMKQLCSALGFAGAHPRTEANAILNLLSSRCEAFRMLHRRA